MQNFIQKMFNKSKMHLERKHHTAQVIVLCEAEDSRGRPCISVELMDGMGRTRGGKHTPAIDNHRTEEIQNARGKIEAPLKD